MCTAFHPLFLFYLPIKLAMEALPNVARVGARVLRVLGQNPGEFTLQGTNTYLIGRKPPFLLFDTGAGLDTYIPLLQSALESERPAEIPVSTQDISTIVLSHRHHDHIDGLPGVLALLRRLWDTRRARTAFVPPRIFKFPLAAASPDSHHLSEVLASLEPGTFTPAASSASVHDLADGHTFALDDDGATVEVLLTPGHTPDSICMHLRMPDAAPAIFTADTLLGGSTSVFEDLSTYLNSLERIQDVIAASGTAPFTLYPGHGPVVSDGAGAVRTYITHRMQREVAIRKLLGEKNPRSGGHAWTPMDLVKVIYKNVPSLWQPAMRGVILHLRKLEDDGIVENLGGDGPNSLWELTQ